MASADLDPLVAQALQLAEHSPEAYTDARQLARSWVFLAAGSDRSHSGNDGYDDQPDSYYSWDSTVANAKLPKPGDAVVLRNKQVVLGASVIESIDEDETSKVRYRCPNCRRTNFATRKTMSPRHRCQCGEMFDTPATEAVRVVSYRCRHEAGWVDLYGVLTAKQVSQFCVPPDSIHSLRPLNWRAFRTAIQLARPATQLTALESRIDRIIGGHRSATVRVRIGQREFRERVLAKFGAVCAVSGPTPAAALEAAHLYRYAEIGEHHQDGGLPLRRDIHRLFDLGLILVDPDSLTVRLAPELAGAPAYADLEGASLHVALSRNQRDWVRAHWHEHCGPEVEPAAA